MEEQIKNISAIINERMQIKNISAERLAQLTGVSERHIDLLVSGNDNKLPPLPYVRGYLFKIEDALELESESLWHTFLKESDASKVRASGISDELPKNRFARESSKIKKTLPVIVAGIIVSVIVAIRILTLDNPRINFENLRDETTIARESTFTARGKISPDYKLALNGEQVFVNEEGGFEKEVILNPGFNALEFKAKKVLGKEHVWRKQVMYEETLKDSALNFEEIPPNPIPPPEKPQESPKEERFLPPPINEENSLETEMLNIFEQTQ